MSLSLPYRCCAQDVVRPQLTQNRGFAAKTTEKALETVKTLGATYNPMIEEDQILSIPKDGPQ